MTNLVTSGKAKVGSLAVTAASGISVAGTDITSTPAELNLLAGVVAGTVTASKAVVVGANKNLDTLSIADSGLKLGAGAGTAVTSTAAELNLIDGSVAGTAVASKALVLGANKNVDILAVADGGLSLGAGAGTAITSTAAELNLIDGSIAGTTVASKALVVGANKEVDTLAIADSGLKLGSGAGTAVDTTAAELNQSADLSTRLVAAGGTLAITVAAHNGRIVQLDTAAGSVCTLPAAAGTGARFTFVITTIATTNSHIVKVANASDTMYGIILAESDDAADVAKAFIGSGTDDTITLNRTTTGSVALGEWIECVDIATNKWWVRGVIAANGTEATPFSATVA